MMKSCSCNYFYFGDNPDVFESTMRTARKQHICYECGETINVGEKYEYVSGLWDGKWDHYKTCLICTKIADDYFDGCRVYGELAESFFECMGFDYRTVEEKDETDF